MKTCSECHQEIPPSLPVPPLDELVCYILAAQARDRKQQVSYSGRNFSTYDLKQAVKWQLEWEQKERWLKALLEVRAKGN